MPRRLLLPLALLLSASVAAQPDPEAERAADSLLFAARDAYRAAFVGHSSLAASSREGTLYYRIEEDGTAHCRVVSDAGGAARADENPLLSVVCFIAQITMDDPSVSPSAQVDSVWVRREVVDGTPIHVVGASTPDDPGGMERIEFGIEEETLQIRHLRVAGMFEPGAPMTMEVRYDDIRPEAGVPFPRQIQLQIDGFSALFEELTARQGKSLRELLSEGQAQQKTRPTMMGAFALRAIKATIAGQPLVVDFAIEEVRLDEPIPEGVFWDGP